ncbi:MAG: hypothetical protein M3292_08565 [Actinomycetota bacterium]|nr:hypothetical protein [Actinomycetota bacterium]
MIYAVDHVVCAVSAVERDSLATRLLEAGLRSLPLHLDFAEIGAASDSYATASGSFVELVYETARGRAPQAWCTELPRVIGIGFSSDDFKSDIAEWVKRDGAWTMDEEHVLGDGSSVKIRAAGPHPHFDDFYVFVMDRAGGLPYRDHGATARLAAITLAGQRADEWRERLAAWLGVEENVGDTTLAFTLVSHPSIRASLAFETALSVEPIELGAGSMRFVSTGENGAYPF